MGFMGQRKIRLFLLVGAIALGLISRMPFVPKSVYPYAGDFFYGMMMSFLMGLAFISFSRAENFKAAFLLCCLIEISQLNQSETLNYLRSFRIGALVLGRGFLWSDLLCYLGGTYLASYLIIWSDKLPVRQ